VTKRQHTRLAAVGAVTLACCLLLSFWIVRLRSSAAAQAVSSVALGLHPVASTGQAGARPQPDLRAVDAPLGRCEQRIERGPNLAPTLAVVGASYTAGEGPGNPAQSWAVGLARLLHWNAVIYGVPGAGYVRAASSGRGPMDRMLSQEQLRGLDPALVIVQAGHDDAGVPAGLERRQVGVAVNLIRSASPAARIALLTTFSGAAGGTPALRDIDQAIVAAAAAADPQVIVMDPLAGRWQFPRAHDGLHPTAGGDAWIAHTVAAILAARGVRPAPLTAAAPVICDASVGVGDPVTA
jgi:lysophospholipase L1-like esterase